MADATPKSGKPGTTAPAAKAEESKVAKCSITREAFRKEAKPITVKVGETGDKLLEVKEFSTGSLGWYANEKGTMKVGDQVVRVQMQLQLTIIGSKDLPK